MILNEYEACYKNVFFLVRQNYTTTQNLRAQLSNWKIGADTLLIQNEKADSS